MITTLTTRNQKSNSKTRFIALAAFFTVFLFGESVQAQLTYNESFDTPINTLTLSLGWSQGKIGAGTDLDNYWDRITTGVNPAACTPLTGTGMMRYNSRLTVTGEASFLASKRLDLRNTAAIPAAGAPFSFWMWRDNVAFTANNDRVEVYVNTTPDMVGASGPLVETVSFSTQVGRSCTQSPTPPVACNAWNQYSYTIPTSFNGGASVYIIIVGTSANGNDIHIDDFSVTSYPNAQTYVASSAQVVFQNTATTGVNQVNQMVIGCRFVMTGATSPRTLTNMQFNTNGSTNPPTDIANAKLWFTGGTPVFNTENAVQLGLYNQPWATNDTFLITSPWLTGLSSLSALEHGDNYFWITYDIPNGATAGNVVDAEWISMSITGTGVVVPSPQTLPGNRLIDFVYCTALYSTGTSWLGYNSNDFINSVTMVGDNLPAPGIGNNMNTITQPCGTWAASGCSVGPFPKLCPFQCHPPDYELFPEVPTKTTSLTANNSTNYPISIQAGTFGSGNVVAAWIDYNKDGVFNNWFYEVSINALGAGGSSLINLTGVVTHPGLRIGMTVVGTGIAPGALITALAGNSITLSIPNTGAVSGAMLFNHPEGEKISQSQGMGSLGTYTTTFKVPTTATAGKTRMRVREVWITYNITPCNPAAFGEVEDYVVTIIPDCPGYPGYTTWLGLTDNWADPSNWCPSVAPIAPNPFVNVRIPGGPAGAYPYNRPVIRSNMQARATILRIETGDTIYVNAPTNSSLTVNDSLKIWTPTSALKVNTTFLDSAQVFNGALNRPADSPINNASRTRSFIAIPQPDLVAQGLQAGDVITNVLIHIQRKSNGQPYKNFTLKYFYATNAAAIFGTTYTAAVPTPTGLPVAPVTIFSGDLNASTYVPVANGFGTIDVTLSTPFAWSGTANVLIIEMCYDNVGFPATGTNDEPRFTQTTSLRRFMSLRALSAFNKAGCSLTPQDTVVINGTWASGSTTITVSSAAQAANVLPGQLSYTDGRQVVSVVGTTVTMNSAAPFGGTNTNIILANVFNTSIFYRPNLTFKFSRPYIKYPISVGGHWENNGTFEPAVSRVTFAGPTPNQKVSGLTQTEFYDLTIQNANHVLRYTDFTVLDSLALTTGRLKLNNGMVTLANNSPSALTRTNGYIQAETDLISGNAFPYGRLYWKMGSAPGMRTIPFVNSSGVSIPMNYNIDSGTHDVLLGTFNTLPNNTNLPLPEVTNVFGFDGTVWGSTGSSAIDRYFLVKDSLGVSPAADITFRYATSERAGTNPTGVASMSGQRWLNATDRWEFPFISGQAYSPNTPTAATDQLLINDFAAFNVNTWWTIVGSATPLPVSLVDFVAIQQKDKVQLRWTTATEINNSHFVVERSVNNTDFDYIGSVESKGASTNLQHYDTWDNNPVEGTQYYYLRQHDYNGHVETFGPVSATFSKDDFDIITAVIEPAERGVKVVFNYNSTEPFSYRIIDMTGRLIVAKDKNPAVPGANLVDIDVDLAKGTYQVILQNSEKVVSRKFFY